MVVKNSMEIRVGSQGRFVLPSELRRQLGAEEGTVYTARVEEEGRLVLESRQALLRRMRKELQEAAGDGSPLEELLAERQAEAQAEGAAP